jgi:hypothetical protein
MSITAACNINGAELRRRRRAGRLLLAVGYTAALLSPFLAPLALFAPLAPVGGVVAAQARRRTCIAYALAGLEGDDAGVRRVGIRPEALRAATLVLGEGLLVGSPALVLAALLTPLR